MVQKGDIVEVTGWVAKEVWIDKPDGSRGSQWITVPEGRKMKVIDVPSPSLYSTARDFGHWTVRLLGPPIALPRYARRGEEGDTFTAHPSKFKLVVDQTKPVETAPIEARLAYIESFLRDRFQ